MAGEHDVESRLRQYATAFRSTATPPGDLHGRIMPRVQAGPARGMGLLPQLSLAAGVVAVAVLLAFGAWTLRHSAPPTPVVTPPIVVGPTPTPSPSASATPSATAAPTVTPTIAANLPGAPLQQLLGLSFGDASHGWAIGTICPQPGYCPLQLRATQDGGHTWYAQAVPVVQGLGVDAVWQIHFENAVDGWLYGPRLFSTHDGGQTWIDAGLSHGTLSLAAAGSSVWAIEADCHQLSCSGVALYTSGDGGRTWTRASTQPQLAGQQVQIVRVNASTGWVLSWSQPATQPAPYTSGLASTHDGGRTWQKLVTPCAPQTSLNDRAAALADGTLWIVCGGDPGMGQMRKQVIVSHDGGLHWTFPPDAPSHGFVSELALSGDNSAWLATAGGPLYHSNNGGASWQTADAAGVAVQPNGPGVAHVVFVDSQHGWAATDHEVFSTADGGAHWTRAAI